MDISINNHSSFQSLSMEIEPVAEVSLELDDGLPTVEERLAALRPSRQLLEFYRHKVEDLGTNFVSFFY